MIQNRPYRLLAIVMAFVVLLSSTGFGLVEHSCMMRGKSVELAALKKASTGCSSCVKKVEIRTDQSSHPVFKAKACCEENQTYQKIDVVTSTSSAAKTLKTSPQADAVSKIAIRYLSSFFPLLLPSSSTSSFPPFFPKFYGRTMLSFVQSFLI